MTALLHVDGLTKRFGGLTAVKDVSFTVAGGEILGILGPNGAGKTTLFNLLTGFVPMDTGQAVFDDKPLRGMAPHRIVNLGLARTFQLCRPYRGLTVRENVLVGCHAPRIVHDESPARRADRMLTLIGMQHLAETKVDVLPYGELRRLEIARAVATFPRLLLLDEPFAGLSAAEIKPLADLIRRLHGETGVTIILIEHHLREFMQLAQRVVAMDFGEVIAIGPPDEIVRNPRVIDAYIGRDDDDDSGEADAVA